MLHLLLLLLRLEVIIVRVIIVILVEPDCIGICVLICAKIAMETQSEMTSRYPKPGGMRGAIRRPLGLSKGGKAC